MNKPTICIGENKDADQLRGNREADRYREADQHICFRYTDSSIPLLLKSEFCDCTGRFVSDLFGNNIVGFPIFELQTVKLRAWNVMKCHILVPSHLRG